MSGSVRPPKSSRSGVPALPRHLLDSGDEGAHAHARRAHQRAVDVPQDDERRASLCHTSAWYTSCFSWVRIGCVLDGSSWVRNSAVMSSTGSTQNAVLAAPPQPNSPTRARHLGLHRVDRDREAEPEADAVERRLGEQRPAERGEVGAAGQVVARHVAHRARRRAGARRRARRRRAASGRSGGSRPRSTTSPPPPERHVGRLAAQSPMASSRRRLTRAGVGRVERGEAIAARRSGPRSAVSTMPSGLEDALGEELVERLAR